MLSDVNVTAKCHGMDKTAHWYFHSKEMAFSVDLKFQFTTQLKFLMVVTWGLLINKHVINGLKNIKLSPLFVCSIWIT